MSSDFNFNSNFIFLLGLSDAVRLHSFHGSSVCLGAWINEIKREET